MLKKYGVMVRHLEARNLGNSKRPQLLLNSPENIDDRSKWSSISEIEG